MGWPSPDRNMGKADDRTFSRDMLILSFFAVIAIAGLFLKK